MNSNMILNLTLFAPELSLVIVLILLFLLDAFLPRLREGRVPLLLTVSGCVVASVLAYLISTKTGTFFSGTLTNSPFAAFFRYLFFLSCALVAYLSYGLRELQPKNRSEFCILLLCVTFGLCMMATANHLLTLYLGIETVSIVSFVMAGFNREDLKSNEASFKYLVFGALASGLMIYGFSLLYGLTGSFQYEEIGKYLSQNASKSPLLIFLIAVLSYAGIAYKISAFPMHFWTPDVYEGAPTPVATFFSVGPKAAGFAALLTFNLRIFGTGKSGLENYDTYAGGLIGVLSLATMTVGNLCALAQTSVKRMLAYSSIAHVGYMLMGLVTLKQGFGVYAILFYLVAYCLMNMGAFWVCCVVVDLKGSDSLLSFRGLGWKSPLLGATMAIFLFSLTGIPLFSGFIGKFLLFSAVLQTPGYLWLAIAGVLNSVVSLYYYAKIIKALWFERSELEVEPVGVYHGIALVGLAVPTVILGLFFAPLLRFIEHSLTWG